VTLPRVAVLAPWLLLLLGLLLVVYGQRLLVDGATLARALAFWIVGLAILVVLHRHTDPPAFERLNATGRPVEEPALARLLLLVVVAAGAVTVWFLAHGRPELESFHDVAVIWLLSLAALFLAAAWPSRGWRAGIHHGLDTLPLAELLQAVAIVLFALLLRTVVLDRFPSIIDPDEMALAMIAVDVQNGSLVNPFTTGWFDTPTLFGYLQAASMWAFGDSLTGVRMLGAFLGTGTVLFTWLFTRRTLGRWIALIAALLLAALPFHLIVSRSALTYVGDSLFLMAMLYWLDRGLLEQRRVDCLLAGFAIGFSQYFYFGARLIPAVAVVYGLFLVVRASRRAPRSGTMRRFAGLAAWVAAGAVVAYLPLLAHYVDQPWDLNSRFNQVSVLRDGWLAQQRELTGMSAAEVVAQQVQRAVLLPFQTQPQLIKWHPDPPFIGMPMALLTAIGLAIATLGAFQRRYAAVTVAWWGAIAGVGLTEGVENQRFTVAAPLVAVLAAIALQAAWRILTRSLRARPLAAAVVIAAVVLFVITWNLQFFFRESNRLEVNGDVNSLVATRMAYYIRDHGPYTVYFAGAPRMWYRGFPTLAFVARDSTGVDLEKPLVDRNGVPAVHRRTLFVFLPERSGELQFVRARYPQGRLTRFRDPEAGPLFTAYEVANPDVSATAATARASESAG
ncbi:MAG: glycosyltransferase family 39 protein, partial [Actinomycetota bacterium]|nr:glycosyltransferase family 39 protein [Actinomycetota bacterium]